MNEFISIIKNPAKFKLFLLKKLPAAYFAGLRIKEIDKEKCTVSVPYKWMTKNPFRSTYFASLAMAAELSTGALAMAHVFDKKPGVSLLVVNMTASFLKKATGVTSFTCSDGKSIEEAVDLALTTGGGQSAVAKTIGVNEKGEPVAHFEITWSFKARKQ